MASVVNESGVEKRKPLLQSQCHFGNRRDDDDAALYRYPTSLIDTQMCCAGNGGGQAHAEIVTPLLDVTSSSLRC